MRGDWEVWQRQSPLSTPENNTKSTLWRAVLSSLKDLAMGLIPTYHVSYAERLFVNKILTLAW